jgi:hypothetical protein
MFAVLDGLIDRIWGFEYCIYTRGVKSRCLAGGGGVGFGRAILLYDSYVYLYIYVCVCLWLIKHASAGDGMKKVIIAFRTSVNGVGGGSKTVFQFSLVDDCRELDRSLSGLKLSLRCLGECRTCFSFGLFGRYCAEK